MGKDIRAIEILRSKLNNDDKWILKLHGDISRPDTIIESPLGYFSGHSLTSKDIKECLKKLIGNKSLLFLGCSFDSSETTSSIEYLLEPGGETEHFALVEEGTYLEKKSFFENTKYCLFLFLKVNMI